VSGIAPPTVSPTAIPQVARPVEVRIPRLGIDAAMDPLHTDGTGVLAPPQYGRAGWYAAGPEPGEPGRAVIAGHVDSKTGPDVFALLRDARKGDRVVVRLADGSVRTFLVYASEEHPKAAFPTARVYGGGKKQVELRLITCAGPYDRAHGGYQDNLIVFARLAST
jgi:sortase (surface protein transpeptidase)